MKASLKEKAIQLRKQGYSYDLIQAQVPVAKSTLSRWLTLVPYVPNKEVVARVGKARAASGVAKHKVKLASYSEARKLAITDLQSNKHTKLLNLGLGIYLGEGEKNDTVGVANSDPKVIIVTMLWLQTCYGVKLSNFTIALHLYKDSDIEASKQYWSKITKIPLSQFGKTQIDRREKKSKIRYRRLPYGTAHVRVKSNGKKEFGVLLSRRIEESIKLLLEANVK